MPISYIDVKARNATKAIIYLNSREQGTNVAFSLEKNYSRMHMTYKVVNAFNM